VTNDVDSSSLVWNMEGKWFFTKQYRRTSRVKANYFCVDCKDKFVDAQLFLDANDGKLREQIPL